MALASSRDVLPKVLFLMTHHIAQDPITARHPAESLPLPLRYDAAITGIGIDISGSLKKNITVQDSGTLTATATASASASVSFFSEQSWGVRSQVISRYLNIKMQTRPEATHMRLGKLAFGQLTGYIQIPAWNGCNHSPTRRSPAIDFRVGDRVLLLPSLAM
jgi:hypothetical protein